MKVSSRIDDLKFSNARMGKDGTGPFVTKSLKFRWSEVYVASKPSARETQNVPGHPG
jgi:hypothetical protein